MSPRFLGVALSMVLAASYVAWRHTSTPPDQYPPQDATPPPAAASPDTGSPQLAVERRLVELERRLHRLETGAPTLSPAASEKTDVDELRRRLEAVEAQLRKIPGDQSWVLDEETLPRETGVYNLDEYNEARLGSLREAFANDDNADPALQAQLENVAPLFDAEELAAIEFRRIDCRANTCRLEYQDNSAPGLEGEIVENELFVRLADKYGQQIVIRGGERSGDTRSVYIELSPD